MTLSEKKLWEAVRAKGHDRFILRLLLQAGVPFGLAGTLGTFLSDVFANHATKSIRYLTIEFVFLTLVLGFGVAKSRWRSCERNYRNSTDDETVA